MSTTTHTAVNVTGTTGAILAANPDRIHVCLLNDSNKDMYINLGNSAVEYTGIRLNAGGSCVDLAGPNIFLGVINAIHAHSGNKRVLVTEVTEP